MVEWTGWEWERVSEVDGRKMRVAVDVGWFVGGLMRWWWSGRVRCAGGETIGERGRRRDGG